MVPALVDGDRLARAGAYDSMTYNVVNVTGPALGALLGVVAQIVIALVGLAAVATLPSSADGERSPRDPWPILREGAACLARQPRLRAATLATMRNQEQSSWLLLSWKSTGARLPNRRSPRKSAAAAAGKMSRKSATH